MALIEGMLTKNVMMPRGLIILRDRILSDDQSKINKTASTSTAPKSADAARAVSEMEKTRKIVFSSFLLSSIAVYIVLISIVLIKPEIMGLLGLEPFVQYMMYEAQPDGYENLVQLSGLEFAGYFFHFHAASILIFGVLTTTYLISIWFVVRPSRMGSEDCLQALERQNPKKKMTSFNMLVGILIILAVGMLLYNVPYEMKYGTRFLRPNNSGIGVSALLWATYIAGFQAIMLGFYMLLLFRWWPKFRANRKK